ncbi:MAG: glycosyltransferase family 2 protein, partial [Methyloligellaceae bacterium]
IPAYNEAGNIGRLVMETFTETPTHVLGEVIVVDDGSDDGETREEILALLPKYKKLRYLRHEAKSGQSAALRTGILAASNPIIATMDGDGQNDPRDFAHLLEKLGGEDMKGVVLVGGIRARRRASLSRRFASSFANWIRDATLKDDCPDTGCGIKVFYREPAVRLPYFTSMHRFLPALFRAHGHKVAYVPVNDRPRLAGASKYTNIGRALIGLYDLFGVSWLLKRTKIPQVQENSGKTKRSSRAGGS